MTQEVTWKEFQQEGSDSSSVLLLLPGDTITYPIAASLAETLQEKFKILVYQGSLPNAQSVEPFAEALTESLSKLKIKRYTIFAEGSACNVAQVMALNSAADHTAAVRRLFLADPQSRMSPSHTTKFLDKFESLLPLGLPLRPLNDDFDSRSTLHRLRCPTIIGLTPNAGLFLRHEAQLMNKRIPNSLLVELKHRFGSAQSSEANREMLELLEDLLQMPVKRPQKNIG